MVRRDSRWAMRVREQGMGVGPVCVDCMDSKLLLCFSLQSPGWGWGRAMTYIGCYTIYTFEPSDLQAEPVSGVVRGRWTPM